MVLWSRRRERKKQVRSEIYFYCLGDIIEGSSAS